MQTFAALYRNGKPQTRTEREALEVMRAANRSYARHGDTGIVRGTYIGDFLQKMALNTTARIQFITDFTVKKKWGIYLV